MGHYLLNDAGDIWAQELSDGSRRDVEPADWGWHGPQADDLPEWRRTLAEMTALPGFDIAVESGPMFVPGPRPGHHSWKEWSDGEAPPAAAKSRGGIAGTLAYFDRLSDALGRVARRLPGRPERGPFLVHDFVTGRVIKLDYTLPPAAPGGPGTVYLVSDGHSIKIGYTESTVAQRIAGMQTGNPRTIIPIVTIHGVTAEVETSLHGAFSQHNGTGEWFHREPLLNAAGQAGGWEPLLRSHLGSGDWLVRIYEEG